ncbi:MAG TPA: SDR family oxidoreductase [Anaerolineales bacterium]|jgi:2'-hydroxyisoflavone reductase
MNILIIGGTRFVGRYLVETALARGHTVTLFNRGRSGPALFPQVETILGDREQDWEKLSGQRWETVIDTCGYLPRVVALTTGVLKDTVERYVFISSISVYAETGKIGIDERHPLAALEGGNPEEFTAENYGPLKVLCEKTVASAFPGRSLVVRPGLIVGPHDHSDRFTYWPARVARGGEVLAPDNPLVPVQLIDVRDLADFTLRLVEKERTGIYNATGPDYPLTIGALLEACKQVSASDAQFTWAPLSFLTANNVQPWSDLPVYLPDTPDQAGMLRVLVDKAIAAGLTFRPLEQTIGDTLAWAQTLPADREWRAGLKPEREAQLLALLRQP